MTEYNEYISCAHIAWVFPFCESRKIPVRLILSGTGLDERDITDPEDFIFWSDFARVVSNMGKFANEHELRTVGRGFWNTGIFRLQASIGRVTFGPRDQFLATFGYRGLCSQQFPFVTEVEFKEVGRLTVRATIKEGTQPCHPYLSILSGKIEGLTGALGLPRASVTMKSISEGSAVYAVDYQETGWLITALKWFWHGWRSYFVIVREFAVMQARVEELKRKNVHLRATDNQITDSGLQNSTMVAEHISDVIWVMDRQGKTTYTSPSFHKSLGYEPGSVEMSSLLSTYDFNRLQVTIATLNNRQADRVAPVCIIMPRPRRSAIELRVQPVISRVGYRRAVICIGTDISDQRRLEEELTQRVSSIQTLTDSAPDAIITFDEDFRITYANPASSEVFGHSLHRLIGMSIRDLMPESPGTRQLREIYQRRDRGMAISDVDIQGIREDRSLIPLQVSVSTHRIREQGYTTCIVRDLSAGRRSEKQREALEIQLRASQKMESIGQLSGGIAHDFNNLLIAILGYADLVMQADNPEKLNGYLAEIKKAGERGMEMTRKLQTFSRRQTIEPRLIEVNELIQGVRELITRLLPGNIEIEFNSRVTDTYLYADPTQLEQVLVNLAINARDAMASGGRIAVQLSTEPGIEKGREPNLLVIEISDTGSGMDDEVMAHIFEPFYTTKPEGSGTGLGLAIVSGIIKQHRGFIKVDSTLGVGTRFHIYLPTARADTIAVGRKKAVASGGSETLLVVEDNRQVRELARLTLSGAGYRVLEAASGEEGISVYDQHAADIDLVIMDVVMPRIGGRDAADRIREKHPEAHIVFTSGYAADSLQTRFVKELNLPFIPKPYGTETLRTQIRAILDGSALALIGSSAHSDRLAEPGARQGSSE